MRLINDCAAFANAGWFSHRAAVRRTHGIFVVRGSFRLVPGGTAEPWPDKPDLPKADVPFPDGIDLKSASDLIPFKPRADILVTGSAHAPEGKPVPSCTISLTVGALTKSLQVTGDRFWEGNNAVGWRSTAPTPFTDMPLRYINAFGGAGNPYNPVGKGWRPFADAEGELILPRPNIEDPAALTAHPTDRPEPAGFGPLAPSWAARAVSGTFDETWKTEYWPGEPPDFDWGHYNAAPRDQQVEGYLVGDEQMIFINLHPRHSHYHCRLPGLRLRCLLRELLYQDDAGRIPEPGQTFPCAIREVPLVLDTLSVDMDAEKLVLVWRGLAAMRSTKMRELQHVYIAPEPLSEPPRSADALAEILELRRAEKADALKAPGAAAKAKADAARARALARAEAVLAKMAAKAKAIEAIAAAAAPKMAEGMAALTKADMPERIAALEQVSGRSWSRPSYQPQDLAKAIAGLGDKASFFPADRAGMTDAATAALDTVTAKTPQAAVDVVRQQAAARALVAEAAGPLKPVPAEAVARLVASGEMLAGKRLTGADLSGLDLSGRDFTGTNLSGARLVGTNLRHCWLADARLTGADLSGADLTGAVVLGCDFSRTELAGARFAGSMVTAAIFAHRDLRGCDFSGSWGEGADFTQAIVSGLSFACATLPKANFDRATAEAANFTGAILARANFSGARARNIVMTDADITNLRAGGRADFTGADLRRTRGDRSMWLLCTLEQADFTRAVLRRAGFAEARLGGANFDRAHLQSACFDDAELTGTALTNANLLKARFIRADLTRAWVGGSNCFRATFAEAILEETNFAGSFVAHSVGIPQ